MIATAESDGDFPSPYRPLPTPSPPQKKSLKKTEKPVIYMKIAVNLNFTNLPEDVSNSEDSQLISGSPEKTTLSSDGLHLEFVI